MRINLYFTKSLKGFSINELMIAIVIVGILAAIAYPSYQKYIKRARLQAAFNALVENNQMLERHYAAHGHFKKNSTTWVDLAVNQTEHFCIKMQGNPRGTNNNHQYAIKAVSRNKTNEPRVLIINQDQAVVICEQSISTCQEIGFFNNPARADKNCVPYS